MAELTLDAADLVAGESGPLMTAIGAMLIEIDTRNTRCRAQRQRRRFEFCGKGWAEPWS